MSSNSYRRSRSDVLAPCGIGELIDKITILEIKADRLQDARQLDNVAYELSLLRRLKIENGLVGAKLNELEDALKAVNTRLWDVEDELRLHEAKLDFGAAFVALARQVYQTNDQRAALKKQINILFNSSIIEEKSYGSSANLNAGAV